MKEKKNLTALALLYLHSSYRFSEPFLSVHVQPLYVLFDSIFLTLFTWTSLFLTDFLSYFLLQLYGFMHTCLLLEGHIDIRHQRHNCIVVQTVQDWLAALLGRVYIYI